MEARPFTDFAYEQFLDEEKLMGSRCLKCHALFAPPRPVCTKCHGVEMEWVELSGRGKLAAFASIAVGPPAMVAEGYGRDRPYCVGVVELEEGVRAVARIEDVDARHPESIAIGTPLTAKFVRRGEGEGAETLLTFSPL
jgi:uncharacterized OB-fold protein